MYRIGRGGSHGGTSGSVTLMFLVQLSSKAGASFVTQLNLFCKLCDKTLLFRCRISMVTINNHKPQRPNKAYRPVRHCNALEW